MFHPYPGNISVPLSNLTNKGVAFDFIPEQKRAFGELNFQLASDETLGYFDKETPTIIIADASPVGLSMVLTQEQSSRPWLVCYESRSLTEVEKHYSDWNRSPCKNCPCQTSPTSPLTGSWGIPGDSWNQTTVENQSMSAWHRPRCWETL